jgi:hypothetical protein
LVLSETALAAIYWGDHPEARLEGSCLTHDTLDCSQVATIAPDIARHTS